MNIIKIILTFIWHQECLKTLQHKLKSFFFFVCIYIIHPHESQGQKKNSLILQILFLPWEHFETKGYLSVLRIQCFIRHVYLASSRLPAPITLICVLLSFWMPFYFLRLLLISSPVTRLSEEAVVFPINTQASFSDRLPHALPSQQHVIFKHSHIPFFVHVKHFTILLNVVINSGRRFYLTISNGVWVLTSWHAIGAELWETVLIFTPLLKVNIGSCHFWSAIYRSIPH